MNLLDNFIKECDIALKTLSFKKSGTADRIQPINPPLPYQKRRKIYQRN